MLTSEPAYLAEIIKKERKKPTHGLSLVKVD